MQSANRTFPGNEMRQKQVPAYRKRTGRIHRFVREKGIFPFLYEDEDDEEYVCELVGTGKWLRNVGRGMRRMIY